MDGLMKEAIKNAIGDLTPQAHEQILKAKTHEKEEILKLIDHVQSKLDHDEAMIMDGKKTLVDFEWRSKTKSFIKHKRREIQKLEAQIGEHKRAILRSSNESRIKDLEEEVQSLKEAVEILNQFKEASKDAFAHFNFHRGAL
jgi:hypothetical protein